MPFGRSLPKAVVTGLKSTFLRAPRKSPDATCGAVQADTPLRYVTAFKSTIGKNTEKHACHVWCRPALPKKPGSA